MSTEGLQPGARLERRVLNGPTMGSRWSATFFVPEGFDTRALGEALQDAVDRVDGQMSTWKPGSDLNRLNAAPVGTWVAIPRELMAVLAMALEIGRASGGAFDIGVGDLVIAWGFGGGSRSPDPGRIASLAGRPSFDPPRTLQLDGMGARACKLAPLTLDLSGIAKGFGVDELGRVLSEFGIHSWLAGIDGEMRSGGTKPDGRPWGVGHEKPVRGRRELAGILELADCAVASSGNYRHVADVNGRSVSHTMDPRTGEPLANDLASVTVLAGTCMEADAWATALMVLGYERALGLAQARGLGAILVQTDGEVYSTL